MSTRNPNLKPKDDSPNEDCSDNASNQSETGNSLPFFSLKVEFQGDESAAFRALFSKVWVEDKLTFLMMRVQKNK